MVRSDVRWNRAFSTVIAIGFITSLTLTFITPSCVDTDRIDVTIGNKRRCITFVYIFTYNRTSGWTCTGNRCTAGNSGSRNMKTMIAFTSVTSTIIYTVRVDWTLRQVFIVLLFLQSTAIFLQSTAIYFKSIVIFLQSTENPKTFLI